MRFLAPDSPFSKTVTTIVKLLLLNFYIVAASIPLITIAPALTAGFTIVRDLTEKKPFIHITARYWKSFAANLRHGLVISLLIGAMVYLIWLDLQLRQAYPAMSVMWIISLVALCLVAVIQFLYLFPLEARYENPLRTALKNARSISLGFPLRTLGICAAVAAESFVFFGSTVFFYSLAPFVAPITVIITVSFLALPVFHAVEEQISEDKEE